MYDLNPSGLRLSILGYLDWGFSMSNLLIYPEFKLGHLWYNSDPSIRE